MYFDRIYKKLVKTVLDKGVWITELGKFHPGREGKDIKVLTYFGYDFEFDVGRHGLPLISLRKLPYRVFVAELIWFLMGDNDPNGIVHEYTRIWDDFIEEDGTVTSYGHRWRRWFGRDQLRGVIETLRQDPTSRHGVIVTWDPSSDSLVNGVKRKNVPCHVALTFMVDPVNQKLHMTTFWRSEEAYLGLVHDVPGGVLLQMFVAKELGLKPGKYKHVIANIHLYENQIKLAKKLITLEPKPGRVEIEVPPDWYQNISDRDYARRVIDDILRQIKKQYNPHNFRGRVKIIV